ncbi:Mediator of RNA polymerase II transcription subunit 30 [Amphibalanus amphitrite]|uniref:Mediator of RNA polymerase II transcription subunit 30 n=1 Tax=Amphibalanus amphitrite TaxID=1232801 RepID=A0A6A4VBI7_AMPAM|nr:Mediator of RNA polymerase II transcription subunit 30 [Amphibalanus amphitrite]
MAGQFPGMGGGGISQNNSYMMQQQQQPAAPQPGGVGAFTSQPGEGGSFGGQVTSYSGYPSSQPGLSQAGPGGYPNPPAYSQSGGGGGAFSLASSYMSSSYGAQSPVYSQSRARHCTVISGCYAAGGSISMSQQQAVVPTATPTQAQVSVMTSQQQQQQQQQQVQQTQQQQQQQQQQRDYNVATLCRYAQEHLLELVSRCQELFNVLKMHQPPNGTPQGMTNSADKQNKIKQLLEYIRVQFRRLRVYHERISECCASFEFTPVEAS